MKPKLLLLILILPLLGLSCTWRNDAAASLIVKIRDTVAAGYKRAGTVFGPTGDNIVKNLSAEQKVLIDEWLAKNKLNEYGDPANTVYTGGTPLFDEKTGESINRYEYLFKKFPALKDIVK